MAIEPSLTTSTCSQTSNLTLLKALPVELIDMILSRLDTSALFRLCHVNRFFRVLVQPRLFNHASQVTMRLWVCQPGLLAHKPIDFAWSHCDYAAHQMVFCPLDPSSAALTLQKALPPPRIDGCTVLIKVGSAKRIYSISYKNCVIPVPIDATLATYNNNSCSSLGQDHPEEEAYYGCAWQFAYTVHDASPATRQLVPDTFTCDMDLLDPYVLTSSASRDIAVDVSGPEHPVSISAAAVSTDKDRHHVGKRQEIQDHLPASWVSRILSNGNMPDLVQHL